MTKGRSHKKKRRKKKGRRKDRPTVGKPEPSTVIAVVERITTAGPDYVEDNFIRIMQGCAVLREEPEFADLYFEPRQTLEAAARHFPRFERRARRAARRDDEEAFASIYDGYRIAVLDDLDTPQLRRQLQRRLERCIERLVRGHDAEKLEMVVFISASLGDETSQPVKGRGPLPLGVYGLVATMYEDSFDRAMEKTPDARDMVGDELYGLWCAHHSKQDMEAMTAATEQISAFEELAAHMEANPALALAWKRQEEYLIEELQAEIIDEGLTFEPDPFTRDEVTLALDKMEQRYLSKPWSLSRHFTVPAMISFAHCIAETLEEIMPPQRIAEMVERFKAAGREALESDDERLRALVPHLQAAIHYLQREQTPSQNKVVRLLYLLGFLQAVSDTDTLSPHWQRLIKRLKKSRLLRQAA